MKRYTMVPKIVMHIKENIKCIKEYEITDTWDKFKNNLSSEGVTEVFNTYTYSYASSIEKTDYKKFDYKGYKNKEKSILAEIKNLHFMESLIKKEIITFDRYYANYNKGICLIFDPLNLKFKMGIFGKLEKLIEEKLKKSNTDKSDIISSYKEVLEIELKETRKHINWLEENIENFEEIFKIGNTKSKKIKTRKLNIKGGSQ